jgi:YgiT-type zinc finger domain-containing protein
MKNLNEIKEQLINSDYVHSLHSATRVIERNISAQEISEAGRNAIIIGLIISRKGFKMSDYICDNCGNTEFIESTIDKVFNIKGKLTLVENIPVILCTHCQEPILTLKTTEHIRLLLNSDIKPIRQITTEVFEYA